MWLCDVQGEGCGYVMCRERGVAMSLCDVVRVCDFFPRI